MIGVVNYGVANIGSMLNMLRRIGVEAGAAATPAALQAADKIILPGIGAFDHGMKALHEGGWVEAVLERVQGGTPLLGVCLGMQLLCDGSEEGNCAGLGLVPGFCRRFRFQDQQSLPVPHMGWKSLELQRQNPIVSDLGPPARFYFVHSYHVCCSDAADSVATAVYGYPFTAVLNRGHVWGMQFHPEKSHRFGMMVLANFAAL